MTNDATLLLVTGAFGVTGGMAASNRLVLKALSDWPSERASLTVLAFNEAVGSQPDSAYVDPSRVRWQGFGGAKARFMRSAWRHVLTRRWRLILADCVSLASALYPLSRLGLCAYTVVCHGLEVRPESLSMRDRLTLRGAQRVVTPSPTTAASVRTNFPGLPVVVSEWGLDPCIDVAVPVIVHDPVVLTNAAGMRLPIGARMVLCVGRMWRSQRHKGQDALIRAMPLVLKRAPDAQLALVGGGDWTEDLTALARAEGVDQHVFFPGFVDEDLLTALYARCAAFALPSTGEGFGLVYLEAMRWSKPCIGGAVDAARDVIVDGHTGLVLADPHDAGLLARALGDVLGDPAAARSLGEAGRKRLEERYLFPHFRERFYRAIGWT